MFEAYNASEQTLWAKAFVSTLHLDTQERGRQKSFTKCKDEYASFLIN